MKFGIRECCDVVFRAKAKQQIGNKWFYKGEPVIYFDSLKTSTLEGAATTVYAQGGRGNARLMAWEGERTLTFTMEDALISPEGLSILTGAGIINANNGDHKMYVHSTVKIKAVEGIGGNYTRNGKKITITHLEPKDDEDKIYTIATGNDAPGCYVMVLDDNDNIVSEPFSTKTANRGAGKLTVEPGNYITSIESADNTIEENTKIGAFLIDFYQEKTEKAYQIDITADRFGGYFYIEASTLFRDQATGIDMPAEFIIPNAKVQSNFTFTMAGSGDPSTFTFTIDAFPGKVNGGTKDVLAAIQVIEEDVADEEIRQNTDAGDAKGEAQYKYIIKGSSDYYEGNTSKYTVPELSDTVSFAVTKIDGTSVATDTTITNGALSVADADLGSVLKITVTGHDDVAPKTVYTYA